MVSSYVTHKFYLTTNIIDKIRHKFKALYPSEINENNIASNTLIGKIEIDKKVYDHENVYNKDPNIYQRSGEYIENLVTDNYIEFCHRWFGLANIKEFIEDMDEFYNQLNLGQYSKLESNTRNAIIPTVKSKVRTPIKFTNDKHIQVCFYYNGRNKDITYEKLMENK